MYRFQKSSFAALICLTGIVATSFVPLFGDDETPAGPDSKQPDSKQPAAETPDKPDSKQGEDQPQPDEPKKGEPKKDESTKDEPAKEEPKKEEPKAEWKRLSERKLEIAQKLREFQSEFNKAGTTRDRKMEIQTEYRRLITEYQLHVEPRMEELAETIYDADPNDIEAAEAVMVAAYKTNRYQRALDVAKNLIESGKSTKYAGNMAINIAGAASFSLNDFEQAKTFLEQAKDAGQLNSYGERFKDQLEAYTKFWMRETELRDAQAKLEGDKQLPMVELTIASGKEELGKVVLELFEDEAPNTVANFISIVENADKNYNGVKFHRVLPNFMAQTGNLEASGKEPLDYTIKCEAYEEGARKHFRGSLSMALKGRDTGDSQFYITHLPTYWLNQEVDPNSVHTVFGRVVQGMDIIDRVEQEDIIKTAKVLYKRPHEYKPKTVPNKKPASE